MNNQVDFIIKTRKLSPREVKKKFRDFVDELSEDCGPEIEEMAEDLKAHGDEFIDMLSGKEESRGGNYRDGSNRNDGGMYGGYRGDGDNMSGSGNYRRGRAWHRNEGTWEQREEQRKRNEQKLQEMDRQLQEMRQRLMQDM